MRLLRCDGEQSTAAHRITVNPITVKEVRREDVAGERERKREGKKERIHDATDQT